MTQKNKIVKRMVILGSAALIFVFADGCQQSAPDTTQDEVQALKDNETRWNDEYVSKDPEKLAAHYADDAVLMAPGMPSVSGKEAIRKMLKQMVSDPALSLKFHASKVEISKAGDLGYTQGSYVMTVTEPNSKGVINDRGSYVTTYRKQPDGSWKAVSDIASSELAPASSPVNASTEHP